MKVGPFDAKTIDECLAILSASLQMQEGAFQSELWRKLPNRDRLGIVRRLERVLAQTSRVEALMLLSDIEGAQGSDKSISRVMVSHICPMCNQSFTKTLEEHLKELRPAAHRGQVLEFWCDDCSSITPHSG